MPGNPLTDPNWPTRLADQVERVVIGVTHLDAHGDRAVGRVVLHLHL